MLQCMARARTWLPHTVDSRWPSGVFLRFISRIGTVSDTERLKMVCAALQGYSDFGGSLEFAHDHKLFMCMTMRTCFNVLRYGDTVHYWHNIKIFIIFSTIISSTTLPRPLPCHAGRVTEAYLKLAIPTVRHHRRRSRNEFSSHCSGYGSPCRGDMRAFLFFNLSLCAVLFILL